MNPVGGNCDIIKVYVKDITITKLSMRGPAAASQPRLSEMELKSFVLKTSSYAILH